MNCQREQQQQADYAATRPEGRTFQAKQQWCGVQRQRLVRVGGWLLAISCWLLGVSDWLLANNSLLEDTIGQLFDNQTFGLKANCQKLTANCQKLTANR
jgi:hypothetical protein